MSPPGACQEPLGEFEQLAAVHEEPLVRTGIRPLPRVRPKILVEGRIAFDVLAHAERRVAAQLELHGMNFLMAACVTLSSVAVLPVNGASSSADDGQCGTGSGVKAVDDYSRIPGTPASWNSSAACITVRGPTSGGLNTVQLTLAKGGAEVLLRAGRRVVADRDAVRAQTLSAGLLDQPSGLGDLADGLRVGPAIIASEQDV